MAMTRRDLCSLLPALAALPATVPMVAAQENVLSSATFDFDKLSVEENDHAQIRHMMKGKLATGESVEVHESTLPPNGYPHSPHHHPHSRMKSTESRTLAAALRTTMLLPSVLAQTRRCNLNLEANTGHSP
ncbi:MAG: hypothetical protein DMG93_04240 [Acidobacteria bacterium]|nr:MAG: hypothetical protein DMG93_04240 [Acidobacteriota bacterium]